MQGRTPERASDWRTEQALNVSDVVHYYYIVVAKRDASSFSCIWYFTFFTVAGDLPRGEFYGTNYFTGVYVVCSMWRRYVFGITLVYLYVFWLYGFRVRVFWFVFFRIFLRIAYFM